jgi:SP family arabinose:H+ symporter-like MFS transporter
MAMGPIVWVVMAEVFPTRIRGRAMAIATVILWFSDFLVSLTFPVIADRFNESSAFWLYALMCIIDFIFMLLVLPETKGKTLEEIERRWLHNP